MINQQYNIAQRILAELHKDANRAVFETKRGPMIAEKLEPTVITLDEIQ